MGIFHGIQVYEILDNGNLLNAVYTNTGLKDKNGRYPIDNEIARRDPSTEEGLNGRYECRYIEHTETEVTECTLDIKKIGAVYEFVWTYQGKTIWSGLGLMAGERHIAVSYVGTK